MRRKSKALNSSPASDIRLLGLNPVDSSRRLMKTSIVKASFRSSKRRLKLRQTNHGYPTKIHLTLAVNGVRSETESENSVDSSPASASPEPSYGVASAIGRRSEMEDAARAEIGFVAKGEKRYDFFGVYDGHGGGHVASTCRERLHELLAREMVVEEEEEEGDGGAGEVRYYWERVMEGCFGKMDEEVRGDAAARTVGATALAAVVAEDALVVANCGDCRAVLSRDGLALPLSIDHKPDRQDELERIEAAGGRVINWNGFRVLGVLATSRSIGDQHLRPFVISKPEVTVTKRTDKDEFLVLASDGLWDVLSNEVVCKVVKKCLDGQLKRRWFPKEAAADCENRASEAAALLVDLAMARGSRDNISVIVVELRKP